VRARLIAGLVLLAALAVYVTVALPFRQRTAAAGDEFRRIREERRQARSRLAHLERGEALRRRTEEVFAGARTAAGGPVGVVRRSVVRSLEGVPVSGVRLGVRPGSRPPRMATVDLRAEGDFDDVLRLSGHLVRPGSGLVLERVIFTPRSASVTLILAAVGLGGAS